MGEPAGGERGVEMAIVRALAERDAPRRRRIVKELELVPPSYLTAASERSIELALKSEGDIGARLAATEVLAAIGDAGLGLVRSLLRELNPGVRRLAVDALGLMTSPQALAQLEVAAADPSPAVRSAALDGIARIGGDGAAAALQRQVVDEKVPASVALAALLGLEQIGAVPPSSSLKRWLDDPLTSGAALRLLGRAGDAEAILPALQSTSLTRQRAATLGLADALEHGAPAPAALFESGLRAQIARHVKSGDWTVASAGLIVLGHVGDTSALATAAARDDRVRLLPALHRVVELVGKTGDMAQRLLRLSEEHPDAADVLKELADASARVRSAPPRTSSERRAGRAPPRPMLGEPEFARLSAWFERAAGLLITPEARARVEARLVARLEATRRTDFGRYIALLESGDVDERAAAVECVTVHETYFFREPATLEGFRDELVPAVLKVGDRRRVLRVWSAGCSTGEEAYTLAILLEQLKNSGVVVDYEVWGTDISPAAITKARQAVYPPRSFRRPLDADESAFFVDAGKGQSPVPRVLSRTRFELVNLIDATAVSQLPSFDIVFCRNVLIYFSGQARARAVEAFHGRLRPGGALVLGHSESLLHVENPFEPWPLRRGLAYRRSTP